MVIWTAPSVPMMGFRSGPKAGVPYDGAAPKFWELYHFPAEAGDTGWDQFKEIHLGQIKIAQPGAHVLSVRPKSQSSWRAMNLRSVNLTVAE